MKNLFFSLLLLGLTTQVYAQITVLPEVAITVNYKYLDAVNSEDMAEGIKMLREEVALYDLKDSELYRDEYDTYFVSFFIPQGKIVAAYDKDGKIINFVKENMHTFSHKIVETLMILANLTISKHLSSNNDIVPSEKHDDVVIPSEKLRDDSHYSPPHQ